MHTFFINTSGNEIENYSDILEIQHETRKLVSLDCSLLKWQQADAGYKACAARMGELIDSYKDINNSYNLIVYIDLISIKEYADIPLNNHLDRYACLKVLYALLKNYVYSTLITELIDCGRCPNEILIVFEENKKPEDGDEQSANGQKTIHSFTQTFLGLTDTDALSALAAEVLALSDDADFSAIVSKMLNQFKNSVVPCLLECYKDKVELFLREIIECRSLEEPLNNLFNRTLQKIDRNEDVSVISFVTNRRAGVANKQERIRRDLRLIFFIFDCVESESIFDYSIDPDTDNQIKTIKEFPRIDWGKLTKEILVKNSEFKDQYQETVGLSESFSEMEMAPVLYALDYEKFSLDQFGKRSQKMTLVDVEASVESAEIPGSAERKAIEVSEQFADCLLASEAFIPSQYTESTDVGEFSPEKASADMFIEEAKRQREHHLKYLKNLKLHIMDILSNYAGRSLENEPALLQKRKVSLSDELHSDSDRERHYTADGVEARETKKIDAVREISDTAYESVVLDYLEFCAGRSVSVTDIEEQCNAFVTQVYQIKESLRKIKKIAIGLLIAMILLYLPFVMIQWDAITANLLSGFVAAGSIVVPGLLLYLVFALAYRKQKRKYITVWKAFKEKSDKARAENCLAAKKYNQLLSVFIPALRWIYEYKLDVDFYSDCCRLAKAKINHHIQKLHNRIVTIKNIIDDLEIDETESVVSESVDKKKKLLSAVDYNISYCTGKKNQQFYSLLSRDFLDSIKE